MDKRISAIRIQILALSEMFQHPEIEYTSFRIYQRLFEMDPLQDDEGTEDNWENAVEMMLLPGRDNLTGSMQIGSSGSSVPSTPHSAAAANAAAAVTSASGGGLGGGSVSAMTRQSLSGSNDGSAPTSSTGLRAGGKEGVTLTAKNSTVMGVLAKVHELQTAKEHRATQAQEVWGMLQSLFTSVAELAVRYQLFCCN